MLKTAVFNTRYQQLLTVNFCPSLINTTFLLSPQSANGHFLSLAPTYGTNCHPALPLHRHPWSSDTSENLFSIVQARREGGEGGKFSRAPRRLGGPPSLKNSEKNCSRWLLFDLKYQRRGNDFFIGWASRGIDGGTEGPERGAEARKLAKRWSAEGGGVWGGAP